MNVTPLNDAIQYIIDWCDEIANWNSMQCNDNIILRENMYYVPIL